MLRARGRGAAVGALAVAVALSGCAGQPPGDAWLLTPVAYDNRPDGESGPADTIDVSYPMALEGDTAGGFWGESAGSWLHIGPTGATTQRFNAEPSHTAGAFAAVAPTMLVVTGASPTDDTGVLRLFDTEHMTWETLHTDPRALGDVAVHDGAAYVVAYTSGEPTFTVDSLPLDGSGGPQPVSPPLSGIGPVAIDVDPDATLYVATPTERIIVGVDGAIRSSERVASAYPLVAVGEAGQVAWAVSDPAQAAASATIYVEHGSSQARTVIAEATCGGDAASGRDAVELVRGEETTTLPFPCGASGLAWLGDELIASVGQEGAASLVRIAPPRSP